MRYEEINETPAMSDYEIIIRLIRVDVRNFLNDYARNNPEQITTIATGNNYDIDAVAEFMVANIVDPDKDEEWEDIDEYDFAKLLKIFQLEAKKINQKVSNAGFIMNMQHDGIHISRKQSKQSWESKVIRLEASIIHYIEKLARNILAPPPATKIRPPFSEIISKYPGYISINDAIKRFVAANINVNSRRIRTLFKNGVIDYKLIKNGKKLILVSQESVDKEIKRILAAGYISIDDAVYYFTKAGLDVTQRTIRTWYEKGDIDYKIIRNPLKTIIVSQKSVKKKIKKILANKKK